MTLVKQTSVGQFYLHYILYVLKKKKQAMMQQRCSWGKKDHSIKDRQAPAPQEEDQLQYWSPTAADC